MPRLRKIDIFVARDGQWHYACSTNWSRTLKHAKARYFATHPGVHVDNIRCKFAVV